MESHLLQMRGLKLFVSRNAYLCGMVASFTDAWIETVFCDEESIVMGSHLLQMRGLKHLVPVPVAVLLCRIFYRCVD